VESARAVLFDLDGVLVDSYEAWFRVVNAATRYFRKPDIDRERFAACWGQGLDADAREFFPGCKESEIESFYECHLLDYSSEIQVNPEAHETLLRLRSSDVLRGVITNTPTFLARDVLALTGLIGLVDITVGPDAGLAPKPAPDIVQRACELLQVKPSGVLVVGDSPFDEKAARAAQVSFVGYRNSSSARSVQRLTDIVQLVVPQH
jgi:HAD superfamily hydrolase (TIGR01509 family)